MTTNCGPLHITDVKDEDGRLTLLDTHDGQPILVIYGSSRQAKASIILTAKDAKFLAGALEKAAAKARS